MDKEIFNNGISELLLVFPCLQPSEKTIKAWLKYLEELSDKQFTFAINEICKEVQEIRWGTNIVALIREHAKNYIDRYWIEQEKKMPPQQPYWTPEEDV